MIIGEALQPFTFYGGKAADGNFSISANHNGVMPSGSQATDADSIPLHMEPEVVISDPHMA